MVCDTNGASTVSHNQTIRWLQQLSIHGSDIIIIRNVTKYRPRLCHTGTLLQVMPHLPFQGVGTKPGLWTGLDYELASIMDCNDNSLAS